MPNTLTRICGPSSIWTSTVSPSTTRTTRPSIPGPTVEGVRLDGSGRHAVRVRVAPIAAMTAAGRWLRDFTAPPVLIEEVHKHGRGQCDHDSDE